MKRKKQKEVRLGRLELAIMKAVWASGKATVHVVRRKLWRTYPRAYSTILTMMRKLEAKGYLEHEAQDRTYVYRATITEEHVRKSLLADLVDRVFDGSVELVTAALINHKKLTAEEVAEIKKLLAAKAKGGR